jgi:C_GCAxxG_C_C family probable redox protein
VLAVGESFLDPLDDTTRRISAAFIGGMGDTRQEACGALSGGLIIIGALYGRVSQAEDEHICTRLAARYHEQFTATFNLTRCADLRANGFGSSGTTPCAVLVERATRILLDVLDQEQP